jgi:hypothetical protein
MDDRIRRVRVRLEAVRRGRAPRGVRYPVKLRAEVAALARDAPRLAQLATALGLPPGTITRWERRAPRRALRRITIGPEPIAKLPPSAPSGAVVVTPQGWRVEGLDVATLLRVLQLQA